MHSDMGLFIIMTAAEYFNLQDEGSKDVLHQSRQLLGEARPESGLLIELPDGQVVRPVFEEGSLLVMNGEGASMWMRVEGPHASPLPPYAPPHELVVPDVQGATRAWFGRMYLPPRDAVLQHGASKGITFNEYREQTYEAFRDGNPCDALTDGKYMNLERIAKDHDMVTMSVLCLRGNQQVQSDHVWILNLICIGF
jgi:hypothetical protein